MSRENTLILLGVLIILAPYVGLPYAWLMVVVPVLGLLVVATAATLRARKRERREPAPRMPEMSHDETTPVV